MKKKLQKYLWLLSFSAITAVLLLTTIVFYNLFQKEVMDNLETCAQMLLVEADDLGRIRDASLDEAKMNHVRITWIDAEGGVIFDSSAAPESMENHRERPEIRDALQHGEGTSVRNSDTLSKNSFYYAVLMDNGSILRISKESESFFSFLIRVSPLIGGIFLLLAAASMLLAHYLAEGFMQPIEKMAQNIDEAQPDRTYRELAPFLTTIKEQHQNIVKNSQMRQEFTANVSHELKTPLTSISGYSELIESGMAKGEDVSRFASEIHKNANRLLTLIDDILKLSELDSRDYSHEFEVVNLGVIVTECINSLQLNADKRKIMLVPAAEVVCGEENTNENDTTFENTEFPVWGNPQMLQELVYNLIDNAIRYNKESGTVTVTLLKDRDRITLVVSDTGIGISKENCGRIFERFYRVDKSRSKETGGTGLGLAIVKHIVLGHHAEIDVKSEEGEGTDITVTFKRTNE